LVVKVTACTTGDAASCAGATWIEASGSVDDEQPAISPAVSREMRSPIALVWSRLRSRRWPERHMARPQCQLPVPDKSLRWGDQGGEPDVTTDPACFSRRVALRVVGGASRRLRG